MVSTGQYRLLSVQFSVYIVFSTGQYRLFSVFSVYSVVSTGQYRLFCVFSVHSVVSTGQYRLLNVQFSIVWSVQDGTGCLVFSSVYCGQYRTVQVV